MVEGSPHVRSCIKKLQRKDDWGPLVQENTIKIHTSLWWKI